MDNVRYTNGFIERKAAGKYEGNIVIDGVDLSPIEGMYFVENGSEQYLWLKRRSILEYDSKLEKFIKRERRPKWEVYLKKQQSGTVAYRGEFVFMHISYSIVGFWDGVLGKEKNRLNFIIERKPMNEQKIINSINQRNSNKR